MGATKEFANLRIEHKMMLGTLGALTPSLLSLYTTDWAKLIDGNNLTIAYMFGYTVRVLILSLYGALIAYFHKTENNPVKLFQLGVAIPALITILLGMSTNGQKINPMPADGIEEANTSLLQVLTIQNLEKLRVQDSPPMAAQEFTLNQRNIFELFWHGFLGADVEDRNFTLITGNQTDWVSVLQQYKQLQSEHPDLSPQIFHSYRQLGKYMLVLGHHLSYREAIELNRKAEEKGIEKLRIVNLEKRLKKAQDNGFSK